MLKTSLPGIYTLALPEGGLRLPLIFDSPHSGRAYPDDFGFACAPEALKRAEDNEVDLLFAAASAHGGALLCAEFPRTYIDVNRAEDDLDPELLANALPATARPSSRSYAGIGLIRRLVRPGMPLYDRKLNIKEVRHRIDKYYKPYHASLSDLIECAHYNYGIAWHINCHSMPSGNAMPYQASIQPDFVLGDRDGTSCAPDFVHAMRDILKNLGYRVALNNPYKGVELVRRHGRPDAGYNSLQIEINKALYWSEVSNRKNRNYNGLKSDIDKLISFCADYAGASLTAIAAD